MDKRAWIIFVGAVVLIFGGLVAYSQIANPEVDVSTIDQNKPVTKENTKNNGGIEDHIYGNKNSKVTIIEYGDFQCPGCGTFEKKLAPLKEKYNEDINFIFRHFPLTAIHPNARYAAAASEAAGMQDKFWQMHELLYKKQDEWSGLGVNERDAKFIEYAKSLELDIEKYKEDVASDAVSDKINFDQSLGKANDVSATPTVFINGEKIGQDAFDSEAGLEKAIKDAIKEAYPDKSFDDQENSDEKKEAKKSSDKKDDK